MDIELSDEDLEAALREIKGYIDVTEEDLRKIYTIALRHAHERLARKLLVAEVMTRKVIVVTTSDDVHTAATRLSENHVSGLPVVDAENCVVGVVSEADILTLAGMRRGHTFRDILRHVLGEPLPQRRSGTTVGDIMTSPAITTTPDTEVRAVATILNARRIKRLPVVDESHRLIGIISRADIVRAMGKP